KGQGDAQAIAMRLFDVADFFREGLTCAFPLFPGAHVGSADSSSYAGVLESRGSTYFTTANREAPARRDRPDTCPERSMARASRAARVEEPILRDASETPARRTSSSGRNRDPP